MDELLAAEVWNLLMAFRYDYMRVMSEASDSVGLTVPQARALLVLDPASPVAMGSLADGCGNDPSHATRLVDQLEEKGLVERRAHPSDRRIKALALTAEGLHIRSRLHATLYDPPEALLRLDPGDLQRLRDVMVQLVPVSV